MHCLFLFFDDMRPGGGCISLALHGTRAVFSELSSTYPLKLLSPSVHDKTAIVYLLTYGGGLVGGDEVDLEVNVLPGAQLVLLSQVSEGRPQWHLHLIRAPRAGHNESLQVSPG